MVPVTGLELAAAGVTMRAPTIADVSFEGVLLPPLLTASTV